MGPDDLLCSRNARSQTPLVGRAQWKINLPPSPKDNERGWRLEAKRGKGGLAVLLLAERARSECARSTRAIEDRPGYPLNPNGKARKCAQEKIDQPPSLKGQRAGLEGARAFGGVRFDTRIFRNASNL